MALWNICLRSARISLKGSKIMNQIPSFVPKATYSYSTLLVKEVEENVYHVELNRPDKRNAMNSDVWREIRECFLALGKESGCRVVVLSGKGKAFTSGIDMETLLGLGDAITGDDDVARKCKAVKEIVQNFQECISSLEKCVKPVICAVHGACVGAGIDLICAGDIRYCASDAWFQVKEVDFGLAADVGTLQRLPKIVGSESLVRELCFTTRRFYSQEALKAGFVNRIFPDYDSLIKGSLDLATIIAGKSPVAVQATKETLVHARDHSVQQGLDYIATMNMSLLQSEDVKKAMMASMNKETPLFAKL